MNMTEESISTIIITRENSAAGQFERRPERKRIFSFILYVYYFFAEPRASPESIYSARVRKLVKTSGLRRKVARGNVGRGVPDLLWNITHFLIELWTMSSLVFLATFPSTDTGSHLTACTKTKMSGLPFSVV